MVVTRISGSRRIIILATLLVGLLFHFKVVGQVEKERVLIENALAYFCNEVFPQEEHFLNAIIKYDGSSQPEYGYIYNIADCIGEIDFMSAAFLSDTSYYDSIQNTLSQKSNYKIKAKANCRYVKKCISPFRRNVFELYLYKPVEYKNKFYVIFYLVHKRGLRVTIAIEGDPNLQIVNHFTKSYIF